MAQRQPGGTRRTRPRSAIAQLIAQHAGHFSAADLQTDARATGIKVGRATIFRTLDLLADQGALERIDLPSGDHAYVACAPREHHHHVVCRTCGRSVEVEDVELQKAVAAVGQRSGFRIESHRLELFGVCPDCVKERN